MKQRREPAGPIPCCLCGKVSLRLANRKGFCGEHIEEAYIEMLIESRNKQSASAVIRFMGDVKPVASTRAKFDGRRLRAYPNQRG